MKQILIAVFCLCFPIIAEENADYSQAMIRMEKKKLIEANGWIDRYSEKGLGVNFQYNLNSFFSIGLDNRFNQEDKIFFNESPLVPGQEERKRKYHLVSLNVKFFPLDKIPFFISLGIGRDLYGLENRKSIWPVIYSRNNLGYVQKFSFTETDYTPTNLGLIGLGYQWISKSGLSFSLGYITYYPSNRTQNVHSVRDPNSYSSSEFLLLYLIDKSNKHDNKPIDEISLSIGYAF